MYLPAAKGVPEWTAAIDRAWALGHGEVPMKERLSEQPDPQGSDDSSFISRLPSYPGELLIRSEVVCGECGQPNPAAASYPVLHIIFLLVVIVWRVDWVLKWPGCMRAYLLQRLPLGLLLANVFSPVILVWWTFQFFRTLAR
jgi:hypothetical protein